MNNNIDLKLLKLTILCYIFVVVVETNDVIFLMKQKSKKEY